MFKRKPKFTEADHQAARILTEAVFQENPKQEHLQTMTDPAVWERLDFHRSLTRLA